MSLQSLLNLLRSLLFHLLRYFLLCHRHSVFNDLFIIRINNDTKFKFFEFRKICINIVTFFSTCMNLVWWKQLLIVPSLTASHATYKVFIAVSRVMVLFSLQSKEKNICFKILDASSIHWLKLCNCVWQQIFNLHGTCGTLHYPKIREFYYFVSETDCLFLLTSYWRSLCHPSFEI